MTINDGNRSLLKMMMIFDFIYKRFGGWSIDPISLCAVCFLRFSLHSVNNGSIDMILNICHLSLYQINDNFYHAK